MNSWFVDRGLVATCRIGRCRMANLLTGTIPASFYLIAITPWLVTVRCIGVLGILQRITFHDTSFRWTICVVWLCAVVIEYTAHLFSGFIDMNVNTLSIHFTVTAIDYRFIVWSVFTNGVVVLRRDDVKSLLGLQVKRLIVTTIRMDTESKRT